jgi:hypothetical protein
MLPPKQLRNPYIRFCKVARNGKRAFEKEFNQKKNAYNYLSMDLFGEWCEKEKGNYGVLAGYGNLYIIDFDSEEAYKKVRHKFPSTFTVRSASKNLPHLYFKADDVTSFQDIRTAIFDDEEGNRLVDLQGLGKYVVGPLSNIDDKKYRITSAPPTNITLFPYHETVKILSEAFPKMYVAKTKNMPKAVRFMKSKWEGSEDIELIKKNVSMPKLLRHFGCDTQKKRCECPHGHPSVSNQNVAFDDEFYYCFHCLRGGNIFSLIYNEMGWTRGCDFPKVVDWFKEHFNIK